MVPKFKTSAVTEAVSEAVSLGSALAIEIILPGVTTVAEIVTQSRKPNSLNAPSKRSRPTKRRHADDLMHRYIKVRRKAWKLHQQRNQAVRANTAHTRLLSELEVHFSCGICYNTLDSAASREAGHGFCSNCLEGVLANFGRVLGALSDVSHVE